jgi:hypothetical protein
MTELRLCEQPQIREPTQYHRKMGSGWFWCHYSQGWIVCYINSIWGAKVDGRYISTTNFDDVRGPLEVPAAQAQKV